MFVVFNFYNTTFVFVFRWLVAYTEKKIVSYIYKLQKYKKLKTKNSQGSRMYL